MSNSDAFDPNDIVVDDEFLADLERRGIHRFHKGDVVRLQIVNSHAEGSQDRDPFAGFIGSMHAGADYASTADELLGEGFGQA